jgi:cytochrome c553
MFKKSLYIICTASILSATSTMCYKKNHLDPSTIENISLDGGKCAGKLSLNDMKKDGYIIDSMKLQKVTDGFTYIYILDKKSVKIEKIAPLGLSETQLTAQLNKIKEAKEIKKEKEDISSSLKKGKKIYETTCKKCHGDGTIRAYNSARPLRDLTLEEMQLSIRDYTNDEKDNGMAIIMKPYADSLMIEDVKNITRYLNTLQ